MAVVIDLISTNSGLPAPCRPAENHGGTFCPFPYHFLYEEDQRKIRFLVLRHDKRHPNFGLRRR